MNYANAKLLMQKLLAVVALTATALSVSVDTVAQESVTYRFQWTHPTTLTDASPLPLAAIVRTELYCSGVGKVADVPAPANQHDEVFTQDYTGTCFAVTIGPLRDDGTGEQPSGDSEVLAVQVVVPKIIPPPNPPTGLSGSVV